MSTASEILGRIEDDPVFRGFLEAGFDPAAFASKIVKADVGKTAAHTPVLASPAGDAVATGERVASAPVVSAESVSSQAEITLDVSAKLRRQSLLYCGYFLNERDVLGIHTAAVEGGLPAL